MLASTHLSRVLYKLNDLYGTERYLIQTIRLGERGCTAGVLWISYLGVVLAAAWRVREYADDLSRPDVSTAPLPLLARKIQQLTLARSLILLGKPNRALPGLDETLRAAETTRRIGSTIEVHVLRVVAPRKREDMFHLRQVENIPRPEDEV